MADLLTLCWWSQKNAKNRFQLAGRFDEQLGACVEVIMIRALQGHGFDRIEPLRLHKQISLENVDKFMHLVHGTNWDALDSILIDYLQPGGGSLPSAVQRGGGGATPPVRVDNHFAALRRGIKNALPACVRRVRFTCSMTFTGSWRTTSC